MSLNTVTDRESQKHYRLALKANQFRASGVESQVEGLLGSLHVQDQKLREPMDSEA